MLLYSPFAFLLVWIPLLCYGYMRNNLSSNKLGVCFFFFFLEVFFIYGVGSLSRAMMKTASSRYIKMGMPFLSR